MKHSIIKLIIARAPFLLLPNVGALRPSRQNQEALTNNSNDSLMNLIDMDQEASTNSKNLIDMDQEASTNSMNLINTDQEAPTNSNDLMNSFDLVDMLTFNEMLVREDDCEGIYAEWAGTSAATGGSLSSTIVKYDYDMFIEKGSDLNTALTSLQNRILRHVGKEIFAGCSRRLTAGAINLERERQLDGTVIEEISSAPSDTVSTSVSCKIEDATTDTDCYPISGYITAYYSSSIDEATSRDEDVRRLDELLDESSIRDTITNSVKSAMDDDDQVYYLGDRETFTFDSAESYLAEEPRDVEANSPNNSWWPILVGASAGIVAMVGAAVLYKKKKSKKNVDEPAVVESADEELVGQEEPQEDHIETADELVPDDDSKTRAEDFEYSEANCTSPAGCNFLEVFGGKCNENC